MFGSNNGRAKHMFGTKDDGQFDPSRLDPSHGAWLQRHAAFDWLVGNMDGHVEQFVRLSSDFNPYLTILAIDKAQAFKYWKRGWPEQANLPHDPAWTPVRGQYTAHPNSVAAILAKHVQEGRPLPGFADLRKCRPQDQRGRPAPDEDVASAEEFERFLRRMSSIRDEDYRLILTPYAQHRPVGQEDFRREEFLRGVVAHKNNML
eukprot:36659-Prymnesium_polylepis.2